MATQTSHAHWQALIREEDEGEQISEAASAEASRIVDTKRREASEEIERMRQDYQTRLATAKTQSDAEIERLKKSLEDGQQARKSDAATQVRSQKDGIVKLLLTAVLNVPLE
jgi:hypothetical protein